MFFYVGFLKYYAISDQLAEVADFNCSVNYRNQSKYEFSICRKRSIEALYLPDKKLVVEQKMQALAEC